MLTDWALYDKRLYIHEQIKFAQWAPVHEPSVHPNDGTLGLFPCSTCTLPLAVPIGLLPLLILTLCGSERVSVVSTEPVDDLSCLTTPGSAVPELGCCLCL